MYYNEISYFENQSRIKDLIQYKELILKYFKNISSDPYNRSYCENKTAKLTRQLINNISTRIGLIIESSGISTSIIYTHPPILGGRKEEIDLIENVFLLHQFNIEENMLVDSVEKAVGIYQYDKIPSLIRTYNPFYWFNRILNSLANIPFKLLQKIGFRIDNENPIVKILKLVFYLIPVAASSITILQAFRLF